MSFQMVAINLEWESFMSNSY